MAGSYNHLLSGFSTIENLGDAHEAMEELLWLVQTDIGTERANKLLASGFYPMNRGEKEKNEAMLFVDSLMS